MNHIKLAKNSPKLFLITLAISSLAFVAALAWNEFAQKFIQSIVQTDDSVTGTLIYALTVTLIVIMAAYLASYLI